MMTFLISGKQKHVKKYSHRFEYVRAVGEVWQFGSVF